MIFHMSKRSLLGASLMLTLVASLSLRGMERTLTSKEQKELNDELRNAVADCDPARAKEAINKGADPNTKDFLGKRPILFNAITFNDPATVRVLIDAGANPNALDEWPGGIMAPILTPGIPALVKAAKSDSPEIVEIFAAQKDIDPKIRLEAIEESLIRKKPENAEKLIATFPPEEINTKGSLGSTALYLAANRGHKNLVKMLLERGADPAIADAYGTTPAKAAHKYPEVFAMLSTPTEQLSEGVTSSNKALVLEALNKGASPNDHSSFKEPILVTAAKYNSSEVIEVLAKQQGIDPKIRVNSLDSALWHGKTENARVLIETFPQSQINTKDSSGQTILHCVARRGSKDLLRILLERGADPTIVDDMGMTPAEVTPLGGQEVTKLINSYDRWLIVREVLKELRDANIRGTIVEELRSIQEWLNTKPMLATFLLSVIAILIVCSLPSSK
jgi:ankyrin repeat protein